MPFRFLEQDNQERAIDVEHDDYLHLLAERYKVSMQALIFRLTNLGCIESD
jgi:Zn-dependent peptidase ImmA (M78 family)